MEPELKFPHAPDTLNRVKLDTFRQISTEGLTSSLKPGQPASLKVRPDGTVLDDTTASAFYLNEARTSIGFPER
jgi:hypothetical protein